LLEHKPTLETLRKTGIGLGTRLPSPTADRYMICMTIHACTFPYHNSYYIYIELYCSNFDYNAVPIVKLDLKFFYSCKRIPIN
jgi:hypothetical protein